MADAGPNWLEIAITVGLSVTSGVVGAASSAVLIAVGITRKFAELDKSFVLAINGLRQHVDHSDSQRFHNVMNIVQSEMGKSESADDELSRRIGACEQEIHTLKDFKDRLERGSR